MANYGARLIDLSELLDAARETIAADDTYRDLMLAGAADDLRAAAMTELILALQRQRAVLTHLDASQEPSA